MTQKHIMIKPLISAKKITKRVKILSEQITKEYKDKDLIVLIVMDGGKVFGKDLCSKLRCNFIVSEIKISSYAGQKSTGRVVLESDIQLLDEIVRGRYVLIVDDILDTGLSIEWLLAHIEKKQPKHIATCCLLDKSKSNIKLDYCGFVIPDVFVVGYGMNYKDKHRELPYIEKKTWKVRREQKSEKQ